MSWVLFVLALLIPAVCAYLTTRPILKVVKERKAAGQGNWYYLSQWVPIIWMFWGILGLGIILSLP